MCTSKFDVEEEQFTFMKEYLSVQEIEAANEERDTTKEALGLLP
jgi:hypothetical protein